MIANKLIPRLQERFPDRPVRFAAPPLPVAVFPAQHPEVGDVRILDEGGEVVVVAGRFTHGHFADFDSKSADEAEQNIVDAVVSFLDRLFADEVVMWGSHRGGGGWYYRGAERSEWVTGPLYVWSGPLAGD